MNISENFGITTTGYLAPAPCPARLLCYPRPCSITIFSFQWFPQYHAFSQYNEYTTNTTNFVATTINHSQSQSKQFISSMDCGRGKCVYIYISFPFQFHSTHIWFLQRMYNLHIAHISYTTLIHVVYNTYIIYISLI